MLILLFDLDVRKKRERDESKSIAKKKKGGLYALYLAACPTRLANHIPKKNAGARGSRAPGVFTLTQSTSASFAATC